MVYHLLCDDQSTVYQLPQNKKIIEQEQKMSMLGNLTIAKSTSYISTIPNKSCSQLLYLRVDAYSESLKWSTGH